MAITKGQKVKISKDLAEKVGKSKSIFFSKFFKVSANDINDLRAKFKENGSEYVVAKKTLLNRVFEQSGITGVNTKEMAGEIATVFGYEDEIIPAKILADFAKSHESMEILGGVLEDKFINAMQAKALALLPSKQELYAKVVGSINAPISGFVNALAGNLRNLVYVLKAVEEKKS